MARQIIIHPGFPKSGTTSLQASLMQAQSSLSNQGIFFDPAWNNAHHRPAWAVTNYVFGWNKNGGESTPISAWENLVSEIEAAPKTALITSEFLIQADEKTVRRIKNDFGNVDFKIVFTLRAFAKILPSRYQQSLKKGRTWTYDEWLKSVFDSGFSKVNLTDYAGIIKKWADIFGVENVSIVIADESNPENLLRGFEIACGMSAGTLQPAKVKRLNRSLTESEVEILRQVNLRKPKKWKWRQYNEFVRGKFVRTLSDNPSKFPNDQKLQLPTWAIDSLEPYSRDQISRLRNLGVDIRGDIDSLLSKNNGVEVTTQKLVPAEMAADIVIQLTSIKSLAETSTRGLIKEVFKRVKKRFK